jgi:hypothetical protein
MATHDDHNRPAQTAAQTLRFGGLTCNPWKETATGEQEACPAMIRRLHPGVQTSILADGPLDADISPKPALPVVILGLRVIRTIVDVRSDARGWKELHCQASISGLVALG